MGRRFSKALWLSFFIGLGSANLRGQTLEEMERITAKYPTLEAFLADPQGVHEYREALKLYMGEGSSFDPVFDAFVSQIKDVARKIPGFNVAAWRKNPEWPHGAYTITGEFSGTGLEVKRDEIRSAMLKLHAEAASDGQDILDVSPANRAMRVTETVDRLQKIVTKIADLRKESGILDAEQFAQLSRAAKADYNKAMREKAAVLSQLKGLDLEFKNSSQALGAYLAHEIMRNEHVQDRLNSGDADIISNELGKFSHLKNYRALLATAKIEIPAAILDRLNFASPTLEKLRSAYSDGIQNTNAFRKIADPRMDPELIDRLNELQAQGVPPEKMPGLLSGEMRKDYEQWKKLSLRIRSEKQTHADQFAERNPFFFYELHEDPGRGTLRLKSQAGVELHFKPTPRAFHAFFAGRKKMECVGGRDCGALTPRRWARGALDGSRTYFTETGNDRMEGFMGLTPIRHEKTGEVFDVVDIMSHSIKGDIVVTDAEGNAAKISFFDEFVDQEFKRHPDRKLAISDGGSVSGNVAGAEVVLNAPAYTDDKIVGAPADFSPLDGMSRKIAARYPSSLYPGGMIYDGMKRDGTKVVYLVPSDLQAKKTKSQIEAQILFDILAGREITDRHAVWKVARRSNVSLRPLNEYRPLVNDLKLLNPEVQTELSRLILAEAESQLNQAGLARNSGVARNLVEGFRLRFLSEDSYPDDPTVVDRLRRFVMGDREFLSLIGHVDALDKLSGYARTLGIEIRGNPFRISQLLKNGKMRPTVKLFVVNVFGGQISSTDLADLDGKIASEISTLYYSFPIKVPLDSLNYLPRSRAQFIHALSTHTSETFERLTEARGLFLANPELLGKVDAAIEARSHDFPSAKISALFVNRSPETFAGRDELLQNFLARAARTSEDLQSVLEKDPHILLRAPKVLGGIIRGRDESTQLLKYAGPLLDANPEIFERLIKEGDPVAILSLGRERLRSVPPLYEAFQQKFLGALEKATSTYYFGSGSPFAYWDRAMKLVGDTDFLPELKIKCAPLYAKMFKLNAGAFAYAMSGGNGSRYGRDRWAENQRDNDLRSLRQSLESLANYPDALALHIGSPGRGLESLLISNGLIKEREIAALLEGAKAGPLKLSYRKAILKLLPLENSEVATLLKASLKSMHVNTGAGSCDSFFIRLAEKVK